MIPTHILNSMFIYSTLTGKKEELQKTKKGLNLFVCGPTVYDFSHLGHARTYIAFDEIVRIMRALGYRIFYLQNITDIDDKIIDRAEAEGTNAQKLARRFEKEYLRDMKALGVRSVNKYARASAHIKEIVSQIARLMEKGFAYRTKNGVYFEVKKLGDYGKLSRQNLEELRAGYRIEPDPEKRDPLDFALWKFSDQKPNWKSPWGNGRPGWHIEDTAITEKTFKNMQYDLHGGGTDLKFPHHECEIAQSEAISGKKPFVKIWMHTGHLLVNGQKMSKSLGNFITIKEFLKRYPARVLRYLVLSHHYRSPLDYSEDLARQAQSALRSLAYAIQKLKFVQHQSKNRETGKQDIKIFEEEFDRAIQDDFNTPEALAKIFSFINATNQHLYVLSRKEAASAEKSVKSRLEVLGLKIVTPKIPLKIAILGKERDSARSHQQFIQADALRKRVESLGYKVEDTPLGTFISESPESD